MINLCVTRAPHPLLFFGMQPEREKLYEKGAREKLSTDSQERVKWNPDT